MGVRLPAEYQEVEYLESTGTQYIDTEYYPNNLTDVECKFMYNQFAGNTASSVFGVRDTDGTVKQFLMSVSNSGALWIINGLNNRSISGVRPLVNTEYILRITPRKAYWNGTEILTMTSSVANCPDYSMFMFGRHTRSGFVNQFYGKIYYLKIYEAGVLVRNFIPCINQSNVAGMYDLVSNTFFTNAGTGEFLVGPDVIDSISPWLVARRRALMNVPRLPIEYQEVPFIIGQGKQYIDTGYVLNSECRVQGRYDLYGDKLGSVMALFGARDSDYNNTFAIFNVTAAPRTDYGKTITTHNFSYVLINDRNRVDFDLNAGIATVNGRTYAFSDSLKPFTCPSTALIFATHTGNVVDTRCPKGEIVYIKITDENGIVVRDMIPCYRKADNKPGMYDLANNQFYTNAGTGDFQLPS